VNVLVALTCGECEECNGGDPLACRHLKANGYETPDGTFAQFAVVKANMLTRKPRNLTWEQAATVGIAAISYRMLFTHCGLGPTDRVLVWGASGGLGAMAIQLCRLVGADCVGVVSSEERAALCRALGCEKVLLRTLYACWGDPPADHAGARRHQRETARFDRDVRRLLGGRRPTVVFEHPGRDTFPVSVFVCDSFGAVVICGATSGPRVTFDARYLWLQQKRIIGSHQATLREAAITNRMFEAGQLRPTLAETYAFDGLPRAHDRLLDHAAAGKAAVLIQAPGPGRGARSVLPQGTVEREDASA
jgi:crotonyl-CoA carboxylase/reductase